MPLHWSGSLLSTQNLQSSLHLWHFDTSEVIFLGEGKGHAYRSSLCLIISGGITPYILKPGIWSLSVVSFTPRPFGYQDGWVPPSRPPCRSRWEAKIQISAPSGNRTLTCILVTILIELSGLLIYFILFCFCNLCRFWPAQLSLSILSRKVFTECRCQRYVKPPTWRTSD